MTMEQEDIDEIEAALLNIKNWAKIINKDRRRRAHELRLCDKQSLIAPEEYDESFRVCNDFLQLLTCYLREYVYTGCIKKN